MARLGIEPRHHGYIPGALPLSYLALGNHIWTTSLCHLTNCGQIADPTHAPNLDHFTAGIHNQGP